MPITNIADHRKQNFRFQRVDAVVEPTWHDNTVKGADQVDVDDDDFAVEYRQHVSVADAVTWANSFACPVTLYLYDDGASMAEISLED